MDDKAQAIELLKERYPGATYHFSSHASEHPESGDNENDFLVFLTGVKGYPSGKSSLSWVDAVEDLSRQEEKCKVDPEERKKRQEEERAEHQRISQDLSLVTCMFNAISSGGNDHTFSFHEIDVIADRLKKAEDLLFEYVSMPYVPEEDE